jgi:outer membrane protein assembly factor BamB
MIHRPDRRFQREACIANLPILLGAILAGMLLSVGNLNGAEEWREWRGDGQGHGSASALPIRWSEGDAQWRTEIPGLGWSTPVVADGKIWLTTATDTRASAEEVERRRKLTTNSQPLVFSAKASYRAISVDLKTGKIERDIEVLDEAEPQFIQIDNSYATPSPILDGKRLYCHFGPAGMGAVDTESGKILWTNRTMVVMHENGPGSSPVLWNDLLVVHCDGIDQQYIVAINKNDGKVAWKTERTGELNENPQLRKSYATPLIVKVDGKDQIVSPAADWLYGYDPQTGKELWKLHYGKLGFSNSSRPVSGNGMVYVCTGFMQSQLLAVRPGSADRPAKVEWSYDKQVPAVSSPILVGKELYFASGKGIATCLNSETGEAHWTERIGTKIWASPIFADGRLYFFDQKGTTTVIAPGIQYKKLATNKLDGKIQAAGAAVDGALLLRTERALYRLTQ